MSRTPAAPSVRYFESAAAFRSWLTRNHLAATQLWVGFHKKATGRPSMNWAESVDEALCVGWIDGVRMRVDDERYKIRFTPRRARSIWSAVNIARMQRLIKARRVLPAGAAAFAARQENRSGIYAYEQRSDTLPEPYAAVLAANKAAMKFFIAQPPSYRKTISWWVVCAKKEQTRLRRLHKLVADSAAGRRVNTMK
jgi:uncharacterized protein YdeI (YjbR/CyaY-like superfamily)